MLSYEALQSIEDCHALKALLLQAIAEQSFTTRAKDERVESLVWRLFHREPLLHHLIAKDGERMVGYFIWTIQEDLLTGERMHRELSLYVIPEYRGLQGGKIWKHFSEVFLKDAVKAVCTAPDAQVATLEKAGFVKYGNAMLLDRGVL